MPVGYTGYLIRYRMTALDAQSSRAVVSLRARPSGGVFNSKRIFGIASGGTRDGELFGGEALPALTDVKMRVESVTSADMDISASFDILVVKDL